MRRFHFSVCVEMIEEDSSALTINSTPSFAGGVATWALLNCKKKQSMCFFHDGATAHDLRYTAACDVMHPQKVLLTNEVILCQRCMKLSGRVVIDTRKE
jgi:hypothetical protein